MLKRKFSRREKRFSKKPTSRIRCWYRWVVGQKISASGFYPVESEHWSLLSFWLTAAMLWGRMSSIRWLGPLRVWVGRFRRDNVVHEYLQTLQIEGLPKPQRPFRKRPWAARTSLTGL